MAYSKWCDVETGVTLHRIEVGIDTGPIITQVALPITLTGYIPQCMYHNQALGYEVLREFIPQLVQRVSHWYTATDGSVYLLRPQADRSLST
jgi:methionyl-tRNA formyltransferase